MGEGWNRIYHQQRPKDKWRGLAYGGRSYGWGGRRKPGHGDHLLLPWSTKVEASEALSAPYQHNSPEQSVVVVRRFTNSPYLPQGSFGFLYLDVTTLSGGTSSTQFPLDQLQLCRLLPYSNTEVFLPWEEGEEGFKAVSLLPGDFVEKLWGRALSIQANTSISSLITPHLHQEEGSQTEEGSGFHPVLKWLQGISQA